LSSNIPRLKLLQRSAYKGVNDDDPIRYYYTPIIGWLYRRRVELCLGECKGGKRVLEVGFGSGVSLLNLHDLYDEVHGIDLTSDVDEVKSVFESRNIRVFLQNGNVLKIPYEDNYFDTVLLVSILEHLKKTELEQAFSEICRVLIPRGQAVYGVPIERPFMVGMFRLLGYDIRKAHFSTEIDIARAATQELNSGTRKVLKVPSGVGISIYEIRCFTKGS
jgi:SAM-dependent methyltransferase